MSEKTIDVNSLKWFYREVTPQQTSDVSPVLLLHGLPSHSYTWRQLLLILDDYNLKAIAPDWLGSGSSDKPSQREFAYTPEAYLKAFSDLLQTLELEKISLVVQGYLGSVGLQYALRFPNTIDRLVILNTPLSNTVKLPWMMQQWGLPLAGEMLTQDPILVDRTLEKGSGFIISDNDLAMYRQPYLKSSAVGRALVSTIRNLKLAESMSEIEKGLVTWEKPTLVIWGMADPWLSSTDVNKLKENKNLELVTLEEAKHYPQEHWNKEISPLIVNFLGRR
ncbi:hydrolase [Aphanothece hegewaldii CCALA 016]|uniref:Hydrolase n=1 Tax=Aphanothece hegewaldii CCALA 016 TaxID=2107694 RepID=A0A2T1LSH0_9CHRO|nr:hydrolase [Aphanothece hegewaldii CCALA 016]